MDKPKDIGLKIGSKKEAYWQNVLDQAKENKLKSECELEINEIILNLAEKRRREEQQTFKTLK